MPRHHLTFRNLKPSVIDAATKLFEQRPWQTEDQDEQQTIAQEFADAITTAYNCDPVQVVIDRWTYNIGYERSYGEGDVARINLKNFGIFKLLVQVRTHVLTLGGALPTGDRPSDDPKKWAASLFYAVKPAMFRARIREGRLSDLGMTAKDTYSSDSWEKLTLVGLVRDDRLVGSKEQWNAVIAGRPMPETVLDDQLPDDEETDVDETDFEAALSDPSDGLDALNRDQVRALCVSNGIPRQGRNRDGLIVALREAGVSV